jgi:hypothetical protein
MDVYTQAVSSNKQAAQSKVVNDRVKRGSEGRRKMPAKQRSSGLFGPLADPDLVVTVGRQLNLRYLESMAGTTGLEPATSAVTVIPANPLVTASRSAHTMDHFIDPQGHPQNPEEGFILPDHSLIGLTAG